MGLDEENNMLIAYKGKNHKYKLLNVLEFNSKRYKQPLSFSKIN
jgi:hypothetical protein